MDGLFGELEDGLEERDGDNQEHPEFEHLKSGELYTQKILNQSDAPVRCFVW